MSDLYDTDIVLWSEHQGGLLRRRAAGELVNEAELDWPNIAEEIESLGKTQARELASRIAAVILHLMKLQASPASDPRAGWRDTVQEQRDEIERLLSDAPTLRGRVPAIIARESSARGAAPAPPWLTTPSNPISISSLSCTPKTRYSGTGYPDRLWLAGSEAAAALIAPHARR